MTASDASEGDIVRIDLDAQFCCFAKLLHPPLVAFYDNRVPKQDARPHLEAGALLFKIWVSKEGWKNRRWTVVGREDLSPEERETPEFFKIDKIDKQYYKYKNGRFAGASREACIGLERAVARGGTAQGLFCRRDIGVRAVPEGVSRHRSMRWLSA